MLDLTLKCTEQLPSLAEYGEVKIVVVVCNGDFSRGGETNPNGEIRDSFSPDLPQIVPLVVENLHAVSTVIANKDLHLIVNNDSVREFKVAGAAELVEDISHHVEDDHPHDLALDDDDPTPTVCSDSPWMLENIGPKLPDEVTELGKDLNLNKNHLLKVQNVDDSVCT